MTNEEKITIIKRWLVLFEIKVVPNVIDTVSGLPIDTKVWVRMRNNQFSMQQHYRTMDEAVQKSLDMVEARSWNYCKYEQ